MRIDVMKPMWFATNADGSKAFADACYVEEDEDGEDVFLGYRECQAPADIKEVKPNEN